MGRVIQGCETFCQGQFVDAAFQVASLDEVYTQVAQRKVVHAVHFNGVERGIFPA